MFNFPARPLSREIVLNIYFKLCVISESELAIFFFFFELCRRLFSFTPRRRQQRDNFFQLHSLEEIAFSLKVLIVSRLVPPLFLER